LKEDDKRIKVMGVKEEKVNQHEVGRDMTISYARTLINVETFLKQCMSHLRTERKEPPRRGASMWKGEED